MKWSEISIHTTNEAVEPISHILHAQGVSGITIEDPADLVKEREGTFGEIFELDPADYPEEGVMLKAYLPINDNLDETINQIKLKVDELVKFGIEIGNNNIRVAEVDDEDWANSWKKYYHPVQITDKITIVPTWEEYEPKSSEELLIFLDPGMAFGTGTHPTTALCIQVLDRVVKKGDSVIDIGTGSGILSITAALLGAAKVTALDLDEVAVAAAKQNVALNQLSKIVSVKQNDLLKGEEEQADVVVANILAEVIIQLASSAYQATRAGGCFIASGIILEKQNEVEKALVSEGFVIEDTVIKGDWLVIIAKRE